MINPDFRALCAELVDWIERATRHYYVPPEILTRVRAALSQPAPEQPDADFRALFEPLTELIHIDPPLPPPDYDVAQGDAFREGWATCCHILADRLPAWGLALSQPAPEPPTDSEALAPEPPTSQELKDLWSACNSPSVFARAVLARYGKSQ